MFEKMNLEDINLSLEYMNYFVTKLSEEGNSIHSILMMYKDKIFYEKYYEPFNEKSLHRMYSETKSFVSVAILILVQEGKIKLNDKLSDYFPEYINETTDKFLLNQTIEESLMMETSVKCPSWFKALEDDRCKHYFSQKAIRPAGLVWEYDSHVSQVLSCLVEKISGMDILEFLKNKVFNDLGTFKTAYMLKTPLNHAWGDSGLMATLRDMASFALVLINNGLYNGKQYINKELVVKATTKQTDNNMTGYDDYKTEGYGYQFFMLKRGGFSMFGMGNQLTLMFRESNLIVAVNGSDEGFPEHRDILINLVYDMIDKINGRSFKEIEFKLRKLDYNINKGLIEKINQKKYVTNVDYAFKEFNLNFFDNYGEFNFLFENEYKTIRFGLGENYFSNLPIEGYSNLVGKEKTKGYFYKIATSATFVSDKRIRIDCQIIDKYFGNLFILISFKDNYAWVKLVKYAENFLNEFEGDALFTLE